MFNKSSNDNVTRSEARTYVDGLDSRITELAAQGEAELRDLARRLTALETLATQLRSGRAPLPTRTAPSGDALTRTEAQEGYNSLRNAGAREFERLHAKIDGAVSQLRTVLNERGEYSHHTTEAPAATGVDYGAVAYGLAQVKDDVRRLIGSSNVDASGAEMAEHYRQTVQYFADVFAKADASFNEAEFKAQAGV